jgi:glycosyltransferase involved in cell wall biosynthesis
MNNLHISLTEFRNESRVLKETKSLIRTSFFDQIYIAALHSKDLLSEELYAEKIIANRFVLSTKGWGKSFIVQLFKYLEYCVRIYFFYSCKNIKVINVHSVSLLPLGIALKYFYKSRLIYDTHELETEVDNSTGIRKKITKLIEYACLKYVDLIIVVSESIADWYQIHYDIRRPVVVLNVPPRRDLRSSNIFREQLGIKKDQKILIYQGILASGRGVSMILDAFKVRNDDRVVVVFMGYGPMVADITEAARQNLNIFFHPAVSPDIVLDYTSSADVGISLIENTCLSYFYSMPNKLFEYAMAGLPVLVSNMKDMSELVQKNKIGSVIDEFTPQAINRAIDSLMASDLEVMRSNAYRTACLNAWEVQEAKMLNSYKQLELN